MSQKFLFPFTYLGLAFGGDLKNDLKYILGHKSVYGDFEEFILKPSDAGKLQEVVNILKQETYG